ncbi:hypothetical protein F5984_25500 [Rudanella paleaurantiibacter]|uniref:Thoeris protein ThsB TIR-like domain-containing protein n=1 Tax=Rudanella paleaurantiibacter TaxID=2614655 RepID=A0A7J5TSN6_9BACT|nr:TIR domain-containing protein [Rudanella paleaurantiibacter]KAB7725847.1 hypothetical protein F5984_25500 [Rudanella paleaurantiibacter]
MIPALLIVGAAALLVNAISKDDEDVQIQRKRLFISHSWKLSSSDYRKFVSKLKYETNFYNHSIPQNKAFNTWDKEELREIFRQQMAGCQKIFVLAHSSLRKNSYVGVELEIASSMGKQIIAVKPYGQQAIPTFIKKYATEVISNNITSIIRVVQS